MADIYLILGGARSGKSSFAERFFQKQFPHGGIYLSTAYACDEEMQQRINHHKLQRARSGYLWQLIENTDVCTALKQYSTTPILLDCLTIGLSNLLWQKDNYSEMNTIALAFREELSEALSTRKMPVVIVSNEVGLGVIPESLLGRVFIDEIGRLHQMIGRLAKEVFMVSAGIPIALKANQFNF